jgi:hypothetical protein
MFFFKLMTVSIYILARVQSNILRETSLEKLLLLGRELTDGVDLLYTLLTELDVGGEPLDTLLFVQGGLDVCGLDNTSLTVQSTDQRVGESCTGYCLSVNISQNKWDD